MVGIRFEWCQNNTLRIFVSLTQPCFVFLFPGTYSSAKGGGYSMIIAIHDPGTFRKITEFGGISATESELVDEI